VGPSADAIAAMGDKIEAKRRVREHGDRGRRLDYRGDVVGGRGVGTDAVRDAVEKLKGRVTLASRKGEAASSWNRRFGVEPPDRAIENRPGVAQARSVTHCATRCASDSKSAEMSMRGRVVI